MCGAEAGLVVNNNAAAVLLALAALARDREVVVSRGELVEIGGGFRVPEIMSESGCRLVEVGTTNRTRVGDYARRDRGRHRAACSRCTRRTTAWSASPRRPRSRSSRRSAPPVMVDAGSGLLDEQTPWLATRPAWLRDEPGIRQAIAAGAGLVTFSGDKLLGGPQAGIIVGRADLVGTIAAHPLARAMRAGKLTLAALAGGRARVPARRRRRDPALADGRHSGRRAARRARRRIAAAVAGAKVLDTEAVAGGGSLPGLTIPSVGVGLEVADAGRRGRPPARRGDRRPGRRRSRGVRPAHRRSRRRPPARRRAARATAEPAAVRVVATAGHVDHGKSSLVLALTGTDPDRFAEEKARGLTIDLGFAFTTLPSGTEVGFVDVPGHVRFLKNMLAGVGAVEVAAVRGRRHRGLDAPERGAPPHPRAARRCSHGVVAVTKADLVDADLLALALLDVEAPLAARRSRGAPIVACDSRLADAGSTTSCAPSTRCSRPRPAPADDDRPRLWIDRVFAAKGAGTVVTGTLVGGAVARRRRARRSPAARLDRRVRVRGIESAHHRLDRVAAPAARVALNLVGVDHHELRRGRRARARRAVVAHRRGRRRPHHRYADVELPTPRTLAGLRGFGRARVPAGAVFGDGRLRARHLRRSRSPSRPATASCCAIPGASEIVAGAAVLDAEAHRSGRRRRPRHLAARRTRAARARARLGRAAATSHALAGLARPAAADDARRRDGRRRRRRRARRLARRSRRRSTPLARATRVAVDDAPPRPAARRAASSSPCSPTGCGLDDDRARAVAAIDAGHRGRTRASCATARTRVARGRHPRAIALVAALDAAPFTPPAARRRRARPRAGARRRARRRERHRCSRATALDARAALLADDARPSATR